MENFRFEEQKVTSLRHKITDDIRKAIFNGQLKPGIRLREIEMSKQMGVSRGPIREALRMLEQEGLLVSQPYKETTVAEITREEVTEVLIPIRFTLEQFAIRKALPNMTGSHHAKLKEILAEMRDAAQKRDIYKIADCDLAFHEYLVSLSDMINIISTWKSIYNRIRLHFLSQALAYENLNDVYLEHEVLLNVLMEGDMDKISEALTVHIHSVKWDE
ncbi:GntR family transcriptional regulator [Cohnella silvisoli]|uniref:GntR family transcriptional regulator n=1 Tax=Cohnella silvisoli TaxID=2873699 RepID=A0ABV1L419_9BACL|nr:GntR family transcriptional regulator [Cohnella silvisoli]MCD9021602.1 GntR family transcriptional regulator [Cohnella silvisoli]